MTKDQAGIGKRELLAMRNAYAAEALSLRTWQHLRQDQR